MNESDVYLAELRRGQPAAIERLVSDYEGPLFRYFLACHADPAVAGDQSAETFVELVRALPKMRGGFGQLRGFVYAVARNVERRRWRQRPTGDRPLEAAADVACRSRGPDEAAETNEQLTRALEAIGRLDPITRDIFVLAFVEQHPLAEVAATLDMPLGTVKSRIHRGRQELQAMLVPHEKKA